LRWRSCGLSGTAFLTETVRVRILGFEEANMMAKSIGTEMASRLRRPACAQSEQA
jgi:hypothetical protein